MFRISDTVKHLIIINVIFFIGSQSFANTEGIYELFVSHFPLHELFKPWQIVTHLFMHADLNHLLSNMFLLLIFGTGLELSIGKSKFIFLYFSAGIGAVVFPWLVDYFQIHFSVQSLVEAGFDKDVIWNTLKDGMYNTGWESVIGNKNLTNLQLNFNMRGLGASGAIMGVLAAYAFLHPNREVVMLFPPIPIKIKYLIGLMIASDFISALLTGTPLLANSNIGYTAHLVGALIGFLIIWYWKKNKYNKFRID